jgi:hypothetical protein
MKQLNAIHERIQNAVAIDFGQLLNEVIDLFKKTWAYGFLLQVFNTIIMLPFIIVIIVPLMGLGLSASAFDNEDLLAVFGGLSLLYVLFFIFLMFTLSAVSFLMVAGFFRVMKHFDLNGNAPVSDFFYYFKGRFFTKALLLVLITIGISIPAIMLCFLPFLYVMVPIAFFAAFFAFNEELSVGDILSLSFKLGNKQWLPVFLFFLLYGILSFIINLIPFVNLLGLFLTAIIYHPVYLIYKRVLGFGQTDAIDEIGTSN